MRLSSKDKGVIKVALAAIFALAAWLYGFNTFNEKAAALERENDMLTQQIDLLSRLQDGYAEQTQQYKNTVSETMARFPSEVREEDEILYADALTKQVANTKVYYVSTPEKEVIELTVPPREDMLSMLVDTTGEMAMNNYQPDGSIPIVGEYVFTKATAGISLQTDYAGIKTILNRVASDEDVKSVEDISLTYDTASRMLNGVMSVNFYALEGTGKPYVAPDAGAVRHGLKNIFGDAAGALYPEGEEELQIPEEEEGTSEQEAQEMTQTAQTGRTTQPQQTAQAAQTEPAPEEIPGDNENETAPRTR